MFHCQSPSLITIFQMNTWEDFTNPKATFANPFDIGWNTKSTREQPTIVIPPVCFNNGHDSTCESNYHKTFQHCVVSTTRFGRVTSVECQPMCVNDDNHPNTTRERFFYSRKSISQLPLHGRAGLSFMVKHALWYSQGGEARIRACVAVFMEFVETHDNDLNSYWNGTHYNAKPNILLTMWRWRSRWTFNMLVLF